MSGAVAHILKWLVNTLYDQTSISANYGDCDFAKEVVTCA